MLLSLLAGVAGAEPRVVIATSLVARSEPRTDATAAYTLPIGERLELRAVEGGWGQLDTGFFVDLRFVAPLRGSMEDTLRQDPEARDERLAAWKARSEALQREEAERLRLRGRYLTYTEPLGGTLALAPPQSHPGEVTLELHPDTPVPTELWVLPQRGPARRGRAVKDTLVTVGCGDTPLREVTIEVDLGGERPIAFSTADLPPASWQSEAPAQEHTASASDEIVAWLKLLARGKPLVVHTSALGAQRWIRAGFRTEVDILEDWTSFDLVDLFVGPAGLTVSPFRAQATLEGDVEGEIAQMMPSWYRDLDGDGHIEVLFLGPCATEARDLQGRAILSTAPRCCGC
jgi:hypothetical protein